MFSNMKVATRLSLGFGALVLLLLALSVVSVLRLAALNDGIKLITEDRYPKVVLSNETIRHTIDNGRQLRNILLSNSDEEREKYKAMVESNRAKIGEALAKMDKLISTDKGRLLFKDVTDKGAILAPKYAQLYALSKNDPKKAVEFIKSDFAEANNAYAGALEALGKLQGELMDQEAEHANEMYMETRKLVITLSVLAVLAACLIAWLITSDLVKRLGGEPAYAADLMDRIAKGDLSADVQTRQHDSSSMLFAVREMLAKLRQVVDGQRIVVAAANRGNFDARVDLNGLQGFQREMGEGLNQLAITTGASINDVVRVMGAVSGANRGDFNARVELAGLKGFQREMGDSLNQLTTTTGASIADVVRVMGAMSDGDLTKTIDKHYEGAFAELKEYANNTVAKLAQVVGEVNGSAESLAAASEQV